MRKQFLAALLALTMCLALLPVTAQAVDDDFVIQDGVLTAYNGPGGNVVIPNGVTSIGWEAFADCTSLTGITIPEGVELIDVRAFRDCINLTSVSLPDSVMWFYTHSFVGCSSLPSITIPVNVTFLNLGAFMRCTKLTRMTFLNPETEIDDGDGDFGSYDHLTMCGYNGSTAEAFANQNNIAFVSLGDAPSFGFAKEGVMTSKSGRSLAWAITKTGELTVTGDLAPQEVVLVASYDDNGKFTGLWRLDAATAKPAQIDPNTPNVRLFWLNDVSQPLSPSVTVWGK